MSYNKQPQVKPNLTTTTNAVEVANTVLSYWKATKLFNTIPHRLTLLSKDSNFYFECINTPYSLSFTSNGNDIEAIDLLENVYGTELAKQVTALVKSALIRGES